MTNKSENFQRISGEDSVNPTEKEAFAEMQRRVDLEKNEVSGNDQSLSETVELIIETLPEEKQRDVIRRIYLEGEKSVDVAKSLGLSQSRIHQIERKALMMLRHPRRMEILKGIELGSRSKDSYDNILHNILIEYIYSPEVGKNKKLEKALRKIDFYTWATVTGIGLDKLDSLTFNQICDDIKNVLDKIEYNEKDIIELQKISKRLNLELEKKRKQQKIV